MPGVMSLKLMPHLETSPALVVVLLLCLILCDKTQQIRLRMPEYNVMFVHGALDCVCVIECVNSIGKGNSYVGTQVFGMI